MTRRAELVVGLFARGASDEVLHRALTEAIEYRQDWKLPIYRAECDRRIHVAAEQIRGEG